MRRMKKAAAVVAVAVWVGLSFALLNQVARSEPERLEDGTVVVPCPTEDSCSVDYRDGAFYVTPVTP